MVTDAEIVRRLGAAGVAFFGGFRRLQEIQRKAAAEILDGRDALVVSATASGKTEAVAAPLIARLLARGDTRTNAIRLLIVTPTRALVNDLALRLDKPLAQMGLTCGRQTSDHRDKRRRPFALITTPESFDSMLVRDGAFNSGRLVGHLLANTDAVFVDEAHLFDGTPRGDQLCWLLGRLRRVRQVGADGKAPDNRLHLCAASATVRDADALAKRLLGPAAAAVRVTGARKIEVFGPADEPRWIPLEANDAVSDLRNRIEAVPDAELNEGIASRLWQAMAGADGSVTRKILVFVPTRQLCDTLSAHLRETLARRRDVQVLAHHGSLQRDSRETAERSFMSSRDAVLVATTTLEVGIDIGDVDVVALVGAPPKTRALLQRIGRGGRRDGRTRVLALPRNETERAAFASMLSSARDGTVESESAGRRWSVVVQQAASFVAQAGRRGRRRGDLLELADDVWPGERKTVREICDELLESGHLEENRERIFLGEPWADAVEAGERGMHGNLGSPTGGVPVVDSSTGETIAHVSHAPETEKGVALGGQMWNARFANGEVWLTARARGQRHGQFRYAARRGPLGVEYAAHVRRGLGFDERDAPVALIEENPIWLHFGGGAYEAALASLLPSVRKFAGMNGLAMAGHPGVEAPRRAASGEKALHELVETLYEDLEFFLETGPFQRLLPEPCRRRVAVDLFDAPRFRRWLASRRVWELGASDRRREAVLAALGGGNVARNSPRKMLS